MAKPYDTPADWREVPADMLSGKAKSAYDAYKEAAKAAAAAKAVFEIEFSGLVPLPQGKRYGFGYRFGKLSVAILDGDAPKAKAVTTTQPRSLADLLGVRSI